MYPNNRGRTSGSRGQAPNHSYAHNTSALQQEIERLQTELQGFQDYTAGLYEHAEGLAADNQRLDQLAQELTERNKALEDASKKSASDLAILQTEYQRVSTEKDEWQQKAMNAESAHWAKQESMEYIAQLESENSTWQEGYALLQQDQSRLEQENHVLQQRLAILESSLASRPSVLSPSFYALAQPFQEQRAELSMPMSGMISTSRARPDTFEDRVFQLASRLSKKSASTPYLSPLRKSLEDGEERSIYFQQFIPYILEEVYEQMAKRMQVINKQHLSPFVVNCTRFPEEIKKDWQYVSINVKCKTSELPKLDHGFYNESIFIELATKQSFKSKHAKTDKLNGLLAIASINRQYEDEQDDKKDTQLTLKIIRTDYLQCQSIWKENPSLKIHWLCGLIPASRAYQICIEMPHVAFDSQFIRGQLEPWPLVTADMFTPEEEARIRHLNPTQKAPIQSLLQATSGMYCLQGPFGTGKTTTTASLALEFTQKYPTERILVNAPTNEALRILLHRIRTMHPSLPIALIGISNHLSEQLSDIFVHNYAQQLYKPLSELKQALGKIKYLSELPALITEIRTRHRLILEKLNALLSAPGQMPVDPGVLKQMDDLLAKIQSQTLLLEANQQEKTLGILEDQLIESISSLKENKHVLESFLTQRSHIVFSTLISAGRDWLKKQVSTFPIVIIDEAAQALVPEALIPLRFNPRIYIHIGDPNQLPATVVSKAAKEGGYGNSLMSWLMNDLHQPFRVLTIQYRMHPLLSEWPSNQFYGGQLETAASVLARPCILKTNTRLAPLFKRPCLFFNIRGEENRFGPDNSASISNEQEALAVVKVAHYLLQCGFQARQIGIITFYSAQVERIMLHLHRIIGRNETSREIKVSTVHKFQGGEKDIMMLSLVRTSKSVGFVTDPRLVNVAMSRAKYGQFVFGSADTLRESNSDIPNFLRSHPESIKEEKELKAVVGSLNRR